MILGSHNSWSYLKPKKWWMKLIAFTARCQSKSIIQQYFNYNVRCFDLRIRFNKKGKLVIAHGIIEYDADCIDDYLDMINIWGDCIIRVIHEARNERQYKPELFKKFCNKLEASYPHIKFYHGRNLYNWERDYYFSNDFSETEIYASVCSPKLIDDWYPHYFAKMNNGKIKDVPSDILLIDFVEYYKGDKQQ